MCLRGRLGSFFGGGPCLFVSCRLPLGIKNLNSLGVLSLEDLLERSYLTGLVVAKRGKKAAVVDPRAEAFRAEIPRRQALIMAHIVVPRVLVLDVVGHELGHPVGIAETLIPMPRPNLSPTPHRRTSIMGRSAKRYAQGPHARVKAATIGASNSASDFYPRPDRLCNSDGPRDLQRSRRHPTTMTSMERECQ